MPDNKYTSIIVLQTAFLGDVILSTAFVNALKQTFPQAEIDILLIPQTVEVFQDNPHIRRIIIFDKRQWFRRIVSFLQVWKTIARAHYDLAVALQLSFTTSLLMWLPGIPERLGYPRQKLLTRTIDLAKGLPVYQRHLELLKPFTDKQFDVQTELFWQAEIDEKVQEILSRETPVGATLIGIAPGSVWSTKRWLAEYYAQLLKAVTEQGWYGVFIGGKDDRILSDSIIARSGVNALNLAGRLSLKASAAVIKRLAVLVCNDSAPLHLANAVQTDVVAIFGPTVKRFGCYPYRQRDIVLETELPCRPCGKHGGRNCPLGHHQCLREITPEQVMQAITEILEQQCRES